MVLVSINCITYNHEKYISKAIESFINQKTNFEYEILIHDDASTDRTAEIIRKYEKKYPQIIKPIYQVENQYSKGKEILSEFVWPQAKGKYIALCEGDDYWTDIFKLQKQFDYMERNLECTLCFHAAHVVNQDKIQIGKSMLLNNEGDLKYLAGEMAVLGFIPTSSQFFRTELIHKIPDWFKTSVVGDYPLQLIMSSHGYAYYINEIMSSYRVGHSGSASSRYRDMDIKNQKKYIKGFIEILKNFNKYTDNKYYKDVDKAIIQREVQIIILNKNIQKLKTLRYIDYYNSLGIKEKSKLYIRTYLPNIYLRFAQMKSSIAKRIYDCTNHKI